MAGLQNGDTKDVLTVNIERAEGQNVGQYTITPSGEAVQGNYDVSYETGTFTITKAPVTVTAEDKTKIYGDDDPELTWNVEGLQYSDTKDVLTVNISRAEGENVGTYDITPSGDAEQGNYEVTYETGTLTINKKAIVPVVFVDSTEPFVYNGSAWEPSVHVYYGTDENRTFIPEDQFTWEYSNNVNYGTATVIATAIENGNYEFAPATGHFFIQRAKITVTADDLSKIYGDDDPTFTATVEGLAANDSADLLTFAFTREEGENVGDYIVTVSGQPNQGNYTLTFVEGTFTIEPAEVAVTADDVSITYSETAPEAFTATVSGMKNGEPESLIVYTVSCEYDEDAGTYDIIPTGETEQGNYVVSYVNGTFTINPLAVQVTITGTSDTVTFDSEEHSVSGYTFAADSELYLESYYTFDGTAEASGTNAGSYPMELAATQFTNNNTNFDVTFNVTDGVLTIDPITVDHPFIMIDGGAVTYNGQAQTPGIVVFQTEGSSFIIPEDEYSAEYSDNVAAGTATITLVNVSGNYDVSGETTFLIWPKEVTVAANDAGKRFGDADPELTATVTGLVEGESEDLIAYTVTREAGEGIGTYAITPSGADLQGNYKVIFKPATFTIDVYGSVVVTITGNSESVVYDGQVHTVSGYTAVADNELYDVTKDFAFNGDASVSLTDAGTASMGLSVEQFTNLNTNFQSVTFVVVDGGVTVNKRTVILTSASDGKPYDGTALTNDTVTVSGAGWAEGEGATYDVTGSQTLPGSSANAFTYTLNSNTKADNYEITKTEGTLTVADREDKYGITVIANSSEFEYDGTEKTVSGFETLEFTFNGVTYTVSGLNAEATGADAGTYPVAITGTAVVKDAEGNDLTAQFTVNTTDGSLTINKKAATVTAVDASKVYGDTDPELAATVEGTVNGDTLNYTLSRATGENVGEYVITVTLGENPNYDVTATSGTFTITKKAATVAAVDATKVYGDTDPELTAAVDGTVNGDTLNYTLSRAAGENVGEYAITVTLGENPNYDVTATNGTFTITKKATTVTADAKSKVYGAADPALTATVDGTVNGDTLNYTLTRAAGENVGEYTITVTLGENPNYDVTAVSGTFTITKKAASVTAVDATKVYGSADPVLTAIVDGTVNGDMLNYTLTRAAGENVGEYVITVTLGENPNYDMTTANGTFTITKKEASITVADKSKVYGTNDPVLTATVTGMVGNDTLNYTLARTQGENVGSYAITVTLGQNPNYDVTAVNGTFTITKKAAIVKANDATKVYGEADPTLTATVTGLVGNDNLNYSLSRKTGNNVGSYNITVTLGENPNYDVTAVNGTFTITKKAATVKADDATKVYGEADPTLTATVEGTVNGDTLNYTLTRAEGENVGEYVITVTLGANPNYDLTSTNGTFTITKKAATVKANDATKVYGDTDPTLTAIVDGTVNGESLNYTVTRAEGENAGTYAITVTLGENPNYDVTATNGTFTITKKAATVTAVDATKVYGETDPEFAATVEGLIGDDSLNYTLTRAEGEDVGEYEITVILGENPNYDVTAINATFTITEAVDECQITFFTDIDEYPHGTDEHSAIEWAYLNHVTAGTGDGTTFEPATIVSRAQAMVFLYAAEGRPEFEMPDAKFTDVKKKDWFYTAVMWAVANGITGGTGDGTTFSPKKTCTRAEILQFFYAAEGKPAYSIENPYTDVKNKHWYKDGAIWAYENGLEHGENGKFNANTDCTRLSTVLYIYRYITGNARVE